MSQGCTSTVRTWTIRYMEPRDLAQVSRLTQKTQPRRARHDFLLSLLSTDVFSWVAEVGDQLVGVVACRIVPRRVRVAVMRARRHVAPEAVGRGDLPQRPLRFELLHIAVAPESQRGGVGKALITRFEECLTLPEDRIHATVPESNLPTQLFLRSLGYKAVRVLRGHYGAEDAYAMERGRP
jgi:ribosomal protein S18 acetylase RimI-like enzyme